VVTRVTQRQASLTTTTQTTTTTSTTHTTIVYQHNHINNSGNSGNATRTVHKNNPVANFTKQWHQQLQHNQCLQNVPV
jgi:hypothetical protein